MTATEELQKAIKLVERAADILQKSQMAFDFNVGTPHHVAYTRTNASGTVSNIQAKGAPTRKEQLGDTTQSIIGKRAINATALHKINGTHEGATGEYHKDGMVHEAVKHKGNWHLTGDYTQHEPAAKEVKPNANAVHEHYPWGRLTKVEGKGVRAVLHPEHQEAVGKLQDGESTRFKDEQGIDWTAKRNGEHVELKAPARVSGTALRVKHSDVAPAGYEYHKKKATEASAKAVDSAGHTAAASAHMEAILQTGEGTPEAAYHSEAYKHHMKMATELPPAHQALIDGVHKVGNDLLKNPMLAEHHGSIRNKLEGLKANPTAKHASQVAGDLKLMVQMAKKPEHDFREGDDVVASKEYGGKKGVVKDMTDSGYITVKHHDGTSAHYHHSDLNHHDGWDDED